MKHVLFKSLLVLGPVMVITFSLYLAWPMWRCHRSVGRLASAGKMRDPVLFLEAIEDIRECRRGKYLVTDVIALTSSRDEGVKIYAILALPLIQPRQKTAVPVLIDMLQGNQPSDVQLAAITALGFFSQQGPHIVPSLRRVMSSPECSRQVFRTVHFALSCLKTDGVDVGEGIIKRPQVLQASQRRLAEVVLEIGAYESWLELIRRRRDKGEPLVSE